MTSRLAAAVLLTLVYALTMASFAAWDLVAGLAISAALLFATRRLRLDGGDDRARPPLWRRVVRSPVLCLAVVRDITIGTWQVALVVAGLRPLREPGIVAIPVGERTEAGLAASALLLTLSPGEVFVDVDEKRGVILVQVLDASDPEAVRRRHADFYRRYQRGVFP